MKTFIIINGKNVSYIQKENLSEATTYCQNYCNHSEEVIVREVTSNPTLTDLEYSVVMQAIQNAQGQHVDNDFVDPYAENEEGYTDQDITNSLSSVEKKIQTQFLTQN